MEKNILIKELIHTEIGSIIHVLKTLAEHHNRTSVYFKGNYPSKPFEQIINEISQKIKDGFSKVDVVMENHKIIGFSQYTIQDNIGELEYLVILPEYRNCGYGKMIMDKVIEYFKTHQVKRIDIRIVYGNDDAKGFYEKYGFKISSQIMSIVSENKL